jgi:hypothetical protein
MQGDLDEFGRCKWCMARARAQALEESKGQGLDGRQTDWAIGTALLVVAGVVLVVMRCVQSRAGC